MRWPTVVIGIVIALVLLPMWVVAIQGGEAPEQVALDHSVSDVRPLDGFLDTPNELTSSQARRRPRNPRPSARSTT